MSNDDIVSGLTGGESRRRFLRNGTLAAVGASIVGSGRVAGQDEDDGDDENINVDDEVFKIGTFQNDFRPQAKFVIVSDVIDWTPDVPENLGTSLNEYNTHMVVYLNTGERVPMFIIEQAELTAEYASEQGYFVDPNDDATDGFYQPQVYETSNDYSLYEQTDRIVTLQASPLEEDAENHIFSGEGLDSREEFQQFLF
ncbi:hypothetical protein [Halorussus aquaticus]|uniref:Tat (Twin-arginine translocation) pathway signal sequence n=1 Tax=Halorussus aquaticus TaxID=2953748 RepID=A0ABD5PYU8_9EURY|nr:hypothetical protein [Halorussus aquaticus]